MDKTYCIFGDSVTQAAYVKNGWVNRLRQYLEDKYPEDFINVFNLGIGGNTSTDILRRFKNESSERNPSHIIFAIGVNDSGYFGKVERPIVEEEKFEKNILNLINAAKLITKEITFVGLAIGDDSLLKPFPESAKGKSYDRDRVKRYDHRLMVTATQNGCRFIQVLDKLDNSDFQDGLHPNDQGHSKIFDEVKLNQ